ncbi:hypothetical protein [Yoonia sp. 208BN28-4]|uniref:hypothetical protein n=1 Tax=Yoonia sp. 208BN28-4 TaxID=3126505 RepID=UPI0030B04DDF
MTTLPLWIAAGVAAFICAVHAIAGGKDTARPIKASRDLDTTAKHTGLLVWHLFTVALAQLGALFAAAAYWDSQPLAIAATLFSLTYAITALIYPLVAKVSFKVLPQATMFAGLTLLGTIAATS